MPAPSPPTPQAPVSVSTARPPAAAPRDGDSLFAEPEEDTIAARLTRLRSKKPGAAAAAAEKVPADEPAPAEAPVASSRKGRAKAAEPEPEPPGEEGLSLRERLTRAAAARHRAPGSSPEESDPR